MSGIYTLTGEEGNQPRDIIVAAVEHGAAGILADHGTLPANFFDLSTRFAGELLHELAKYRIALAVVLPDATVHSRPFQEFAGEANTRREIHFFADRAAAEQWIRSLVE